MKTKILLTIVSLVLLLPVVSGFFMSFVGIAMSYSGGYKTACGNYLRYLEDLNDQKSETFQRCNNTQKTCQKYYNRQCKDRAEVKIQPKSCGTGNYVNECVRTLQRRCEIDKKEYAFLMDKNIDTETECMETLKAKKDNVILELIIFITLTLITYIFGLLSIWFFNSKHLIRRVGSLLVFSPLIYLALYNHNLILRLFSLYEFIPYMFMK